MQAAQDLDEWERSARKANWTGLTDVRKVYPKADGVTIGRRTYTVFNIAGNRLLVNTLPQVIHTDEENERCIASA